MPSDRLRPRTDWTTIRTAKTSDARIKPQPQRHAERSFRSGSLPERHRINPNTGGTSDDTDSLSVIAPGQSRALSGERLAVVPDVSTLPQDVLLEDEDPLLARPDAARVSAGRHPLLLVFEYGDIFRHHLEHRPPADATRELR